MAALTAFSKLLAFVREIAMANFFGAGQITDAYVTGLSIPNNLLTALISAAATSFLPVFTKKREEEGEKAADLFTSQLVNSLFVAISAVILLGMIFSRPLVRFFAPGYGPETAAITIFFLRFAFFTLFFTVINYIFGAYLHNRNIFLPQVVYGFLQNALLIVFVVLAAKLDYRLLILGPLVGGFAMSLPHITRSIKEGFVYTPSLERGSAVREVVALALPIFLGGYVTQINVMVDRMLASNLASGSVSALNYANQIINAVSALTITIFITILYPRLNKAFVQQDYAHMSELSEGGIRIISLLAMPFSLGMIFYARPVISFVFERGAFDAEAAVLTSDSLRFYAVGLAFVSVNQFITKIYYSMHDTKTAVKCSALSVGCNIVLNFLLVSPMKHAGLALATSIAQMLHSGLLIFTFTRRYPKIRLISSWGKLAQLAAFALVSVGGSYLLYIYISTSFGSLVSLALAVLFAVVAYMGLLLGFKVPELRLLKDLIKR